MASCSRRRAASNAASRDGTGWARASLKAARRADGTAKDANRKIATAPPNASNVPSDDRRGGASLHSLDAASRYTKRVLKVMTRCILPGCCWRRCGARHTAARLRVAVTPAGKVKWILSGVALGCEAQMRNRGGLHAACVAPRRHNSPVTAAQIGQRALVSARHRALRRGSPFDGLGHSARLY